MLSNLEIVGRLLMAALLGAAIGFERERLSWAAGLRTHMLVSVGSALVMIVSAFGFEDIRTLSNVALDPSRVAAQVVSGIGFLGAGSILLRGEVVRGLTTAASIWSVAGVGLAVGGGLYVGAVSATVVILLILAGVKPLERFLRRTKIRREVVLATDRDTLDLQAIDSVIQSRGARLKQMIVRHNSSVEARDDVTIAISRVSPRSFAEICEQLRATHGIHEVREVLD
ncbi:MULTISPECIES: MgtC/SapB family protein [Burkholderia]|jgi:putative Mg2+ transporter-C (MgtC) family protein|uniref:Protein MgtC n=1 Tax=Burkholderia gladioli TaxID=28095 RepID=A0AAW7RDZ9_BURGA|nr:MULTISPECIES: MgtC/SapB family protein [Burkholderia]AJX00235.1 mgtC family protein [Burkholderia gladioli]ASD80378.1 methyltransferase [Burkholderia gladioli pv. gladioli]AWY54380.1 methyltransferase [Burkholderia gladioli pv. gladioli]KGC10940.1 mgtC family protein [Burkholderia gladioli]MBA1366407.1 MgtC/SapB family protein [Burkholderia gladioli]